MLASNTRVVRVGRLCAAAEPDLQSGTVLAKGNPAAWQAIPCRCPWSAHLPDRPVSKPNC